MRFSAGALAPPKAAILLFALSLVPAWAQVRPAKAAAQVRQAAKTAAPPSGTVTVASIGKPPVSRQTIAALEKDFDGKLAVTGGIDAINLLGSTRGLYLPGYGAVFTTELSLVTTPRINPFKPQITQEEAVQVHQRKLNQLPLLIKDMREMVRTTAATLDNVPANDQIVVSVRLLYLSWENTAGLPSEIVMKATRKGALTGDIKEEEQ